MKKLIALAALAFALAATTVTIVIIQPQPAAACPSPLIVAVPFRAHPPSPGFASASDWPERVMHDRAAF